MIKRKLQVILFAVLLTFSAAAQSQTALINPLLTRLVQQFLAAHIAGPYSGDANEAINILFAAEGFDDSLAQGSGGAVVVDGEVQEVNDVIDLFDALVALADQPGFDPLTITVLAAASPNS